MNTMIYKNNNLNLKKNKKNKRGFIFGCLIFFIIALVLIVFIGLIAGFVYLSKIPRLEELTPSEIAETSKVYALDGSLITEFHAEENREIIPFSRMSKHIKNAVVAVEDKRFYEHQGVDYKRIIGALIADIKSGSAAQGASTITMQYIKNVYFSPEKTISRKINEAIIAVQLERNYTKDKILEMYLNTIYFGSGAYGVEKASQIYFGIHASELNIAQSALLAGLIRAPEIYNPFNNIEKAKFRRNIVLKLMYDQGLITKDEYLNALSEKIVLNKESINISQEEQNRIAPYFIDYVKQQLYEKKFTSQDVFRGGLRIYTTLDLNLQKKAEEAINKIFPEDPGPSYGLVSIDPNNGYIYALVGGKNYSQSKFNVITQGRRQPGSIFKVPVLIEYIRQHFSPNDKYNPNGPITIDLQSGPDWIVDNYGGQKFDTDQMSVIDATIYSVNVVYAQLIMKIGPENVEKLLSEMNINDIGHNPAIALGGLEDGITPLDVSKIFSTLASNGVYREPVCILKITDSSGNILYELNPEDNEKIVIDQPSAYYATKILERVITEGTGKRANIGRPAAGKTGTTSDYRDAWFAGYTPQLSTVVWMGHLESNKPIEKINGTTVVGGTFPAEIWREFMSSALKDKPVLQFQSPDGELIDVQICKDSGLLPTFWCPKESLEYRIYIKGKEPKEYCNIHNKIEVPDVIGKNIEEAKQILESLNFIITEVREFNDTYNENIVFKTDPSPKNIVESLSGEPLSITLYVSKGLETIAMPNLIGVEKNTAVDVLKSLGIKNIEIINDYSDLQSIGLVFKQEPSQDSSITKNTKVTLYVSKGENPEGVIPSVIGLTENEAVEKLNNLGFKNINIIYEESQKEKDKVFSQTPDSGLNYLKTNEIIIKISLGIKLPNVIGLQKMAAVNLLESLGFIVDILPDPTAKGIVISQSPEKDTYLNYGSLVKITIQTEPETTQTSPES